MVFTKRQLIQVVPQLLPGRCGVSDQALLLAQELRSAFDIESSFVVLNSEERCDVPYRVIYSSPRKLVEICNSISEGQTATLLVHLSGYGYDPHGAPAHLAEALAQARARGRFNIAVYFHELFATGMPWKSAFWYSHRQRAAVRRIAELCDLSVTNSRKHANWLEQEPARRTSEPVEVLPVFSAVGETQTPTPMREREPIMAVFGLISTRQRAYRELASQSNTLVRLGIREVLDIGQGNDTPTSLAGISIRRMGAMEAANVAGLLSRIAFGYVAYKAMHLAKSSIFASFCAQGIVSLIATPFSGEVDGLRDGVHLLSRLTIDGAMATGLEGCSREAWRWYSGHRIHAHAAMYAHWMDRIEQAT